MQTACPHGDLTDGGLNSRQGRSVRVSSYNSQFLCDPKTKNDYFDICFKTKNGKTVFLSGCKKRKTTTNDYKMSRFIIFQHSLSPLLNLERRTNQPMTSRVFSLLDSKTKNEKPSHMVCSFFRFQTRKPNSNNGPIFLFAVSSFSFLIKDEK